MIDKFRILAKPLSLRRTAAARPPERAAPAGPKDEFFDWVEHVARQERISYPNAMAKVRATRPALFQRAFPRDARAAEKLHCRLVSCEPPAASNSNAVHELLAA